LLSATPQIILNYFDFPKENVYDLKTDYGYIKELYFYSKENTPEAIVQSMSIGEKCLFFGDAQESWELKNKFEDSSFICARGNRLYKANECTPAMNQITERQMFENSLLATTKVLDNGVNIIDRDLKTIIINILDPISLIQCLGRKRNTDNEDTIKVYIKNQHKGTILFNYKLIMNELKQLSDFEKLPVDIFVSKYRKKDIANVLDYDRNINIAKKFYLIFMKDFYENIIKDKNGYKIKIAKLLSKTYEDIKDGDVEGEKKDIREIMDKYTGIRMDKDQQEKFKQEFFNCIYAPKKTNYRRRAIRSINAVLLEDELPYEINSKLDYRENRRIGKVVWVITRVE
jgi:hypothetical protein